MTKRCFGVFSVYSKDSTVCKECDQCKDCVTVAYCELRNLHGVDNLERLIKKHEKAMAAVGVRLANSHVIPSVKSAQEKKALADFLKELEERGVCGKGWVDFNYEEPEFFIRVARFIRLNEKTTQENVLKDLRIIEPDSGISLMHAALALQALKANGIIKTRGQTIRWAI